MQNTLLGIAIALILALAAALVGPSLVNWNNHRAFFEAEAGRLTGLPVQVTGAIDVSILPTPAITLRAIEIGHSNDESRLRAGALALTLGLGPLMRGELKAVDVRLVGPELSLKLNQSGTLELPRMAMGIKGDTISIDHLTVEDGRAILIDATSGVRMVLDKITFKGQVRSLLGPFRGAGSFVIADGRYTYRINTARLAEDGLKLKLGIDSERPLTVEADGTVALDQGAPRFEGNLLLTRPVGVALPSGKAMVSEPWRATGKVKITSATALFEQVEFQYGPEERMVKLNGAAEIKFGDQPRLQGVLSAHHIDLDRLIARPDLTRNLPVAAIKTFAEMFNGMLQPPLPTRLALNVDAVTMGGATLQMVNGDLSTRGQEWQLERLEFRAPGFTQVSANGRLEMTKGLGFAGFADVNSTDSMALIAWLTGRANPSPGLIKRLSAQGNVTLTSDRIAVEQLKSKYDQATLGGRFDYAWPIGDRPSHIYAELGATEIDIDAWMQIAETMFAGVNLERPREVELALDIERARVVGFDARKAAIDLKMDGNGIDLKRLSIDGFGGTTLEAAGSIETLSSLPRGNIKVDLDARDLGGVIALADRFMPPLVDPIRRLAGRQYAAKLSANIGMESSSPDAATKRATAKIAVDGQIGAYRINLLAGASADPGAFARADLAALAGAELRLEGQMDTEDGAVLLALLNLDRMTANEKRPGRLKLTADGPLNRDIRIDGRLAAGLIDVAGTGIANLSIDQPSTAKFSQISGTVGGSKIQSRLVLTLGSPARIDGVIEADRVDVPASIAAVIGTSPQRLRSNDERGIEKWSLEPFAQGASNLAGQIEMKVARAVFNEKLVARSVQALLQFGPSKVAIEVKDADLAAGRLTGQLSFFSSSEGLSSLGDFELTGADTSALIPIDGRTPVSGTLSLQATIEGAGLSPAAFLGSLHGNGTITFENGRFAGLNPNLFDALTRAVDLGIQADNKQIREFVAIILNNGHLPVKKADGKITVVGGQARLSEPNVEADGANLGVTAVLTLSNLNLDATLALSGSTAAGVRPAVTVTLKGPLTAPNTAFNSDMLASWLALRSVEQQSKRLETIEAVRRAIGQSTSLLPATSTTAAARAGEDDDANSQQAQTSPESSPITPDTTGGILGIMHVPPLPPPVTIDR